jgi:hypothetical protein
MANPWVNEREKEGQYKINNGKFDNITKKVGAPEKY